MNTCITIPIMNQSSILWYFNNTPEGGDLYQLDDFFIFLNCPNAPPRYFYVTTIQNDIVSQWGQNHKPNLENRNFRL